MNPVLLRLKKGVYEEIIFLDFLPEKGEEKRVNTQAITEDLETLAWGKGTTDTQVLMTHLH